MSDIEMRVKIPKSLMKRLQKLRAKAGHKYMTAFLKDALMDYAARAEGHAAKPELFIKHTRKDMEHCELFL